MSGTDTFLTPNREGACGTRAEKEGAGRHAGDSLEKGSLMLIKGSVRIALSSP